MANDMAWPRVENGGNNGGGGAGTGSGEAEAPSEAPEEVAEARVVVQEEEEEAGGDHAAAAHALNSPDMSPAAGERLRDLVAESSAREVEGR